MPHKDAEARKAYQKQYYDTHREHKLAKGKEWRDAQPGYNTNHTRDWRAKNPEQSAAYSTAYSRMWRERNRDEKYRERDRQRQKKRRLLHPDIFRIKDKITRAKRLKTIGDLAKNDIEFITNRDNWRCSICHNKVRHDKFSIDHILPISKGGTNDLANLRLAHISCNSSRSNIGSAQLRIFA